MRGIREWWSRLTNWRGYLLNFRNRGLINLIDVGSVGGLPYPWRPNANLIRFLLSFDPLDSIKRRRNQVTYDTALWEEEGTLPFYVYKGLDSTGSSFFKQNVEYVREHYSELKGRGPRYLADTWFERSQLVKTIEVRCRAIDDVIRDEFPSIDFHFMKIDAQGAELSILKGGRSLLSGSCVGLELELFTLPLYCGIPLLDDVADYLARFGFTMVRKNPPHGTFDSQHDCLFLKERGDPALLALIRQVYGITE